ncbi:hypothetical protein GCM10025779_17620 [Arthrobacter cryoconiti]
MPQNEYLFRVAKSTPRSGATAAKRRRNGVKAKESGPARDPDSFDEAAGSLLACYNIQGDNS